MRRPFLSFFSSAAVASALVLGAAPAQAQVHTDVGVNVGVMKRFLAQRDPGISDGGFGPAFELRAHIALLPLVRIGAYVEHDVAPQSGAGTRQLTAAGLHFRLLSPMPRAPLRLYAVLGVGYVAAYAKSFTADTVVQPGPPPVTATAAFPGASGSFFEIPFGLGTAYRLARFLDLTAEVGGRFGFGFGGDAYNDRVGSSSNLTQTVFLGKDTFALSLSLGLSFEL